MSKIPYGRFFDGGTRQIGFVIATLLTGLIASSGCLGDDNSNDDGESHSSSTNPNDVTAGNGTGPNNDGECVGIVPSYAAQNWNSGPRTAAATDCPHGPGTCVGDPMPTWLLEDVSPSSCGFGKTYGLETFKGNVVVVALLAGW